MGFTRRTIFKSLGFATLPVPVSATPSSVDHTENKWGNFVRNQIEFALNHNNDHDRVINYDYQPDSIEQAISFQNAVPEPLLTRIQTHSSTRFSTLEPLDDSTGFLVEVTYQAPRSTRKQMPEEVTVFEEYATLVNTEGVYRVNAACADFDTVSVFLDGRAPQAISKIQQDKRIQITSATRVNHDNEIAELVIEPAEAKTS